MNRFIAVVAIALLAAVALFFFARSGNRPDTNPGAPETPVATPAPARAEASGDATAEPEAPAPEPTGAISGTIAGIGPDEIAHVSVATGPITMPETLDAAWLKAHGDRVVFKEKLEEGNAFSFDAVPVGNYTVMVAVINREKPGPPAQWRTAAEGVQVVVDTTAEVTLDVD